MSVKQNKRKTKIIKKFNVMMSQWRYKQESCLPWIFVNWDLSERTTGDKQGKRRMRWCTPSNMHPPLWYGIHVSLEEANILIPQLISYHINLHNKYKSGKLNRNNNVIMTWESEINIKAQGHSRFRRKITPFREHTFLASGPTWKRIASCILIARCWERRGKHYPSPQMMMKAKLKSSHPY